MGWRLSAIFVVCRAGTAEERCVDLQVFSLAPRPAEGGLVLRMSGAECGGKDCQRITRGARYLLSANYVSATRQALLSRAPAQLELETNSPRRACEEAKQDQN